MCECSIVQCEIRSMPCAGQKLLFVFFFTSVERYCSQTHAYTHTPTYARTHKSTQTISMSKRWIFLYFDGSLNRPRKIMKHVLLLIFNTFVVVNSFRYYQRNEITFLVGSVLFLRILVSNPQMTFVHFTNKKKKNRRHSPFLFFFILFSSFHHFCPKS